jgi:hypothetical protein
MPNKLVEAKPHMLPSEFEIEAADPKYGFSVNYIGEAVHYVPNPLIDDGKPGATIKQVTTPMVMAESIVNDYVNSQIATTGDAKPGMFWLAGRYDHSEVEELFAEELAAARERHRRWYINLTRMADSDWNKNHNIMVISDLQRTAAKSIGHKAEWVTAITAEAPMMIKCKFCQVDINPEVVKCPNCKEVVNEKKYKELVGA